MSRPSSVDALPMEIRDEIDRRLLTERHTQLRVTAWVKAQGYAMSKSAMNRYAKRIAHGREDLQALLVGGATLPEAIVGLLSDDDEKLADLIDEVMTLQVRQAAALSRLHAYLRDEYRAAKRQAKAQSDVADLAEELAGSAREEREDRDDE